MLKPEEIKNITFEQSVFSGYKKEDVDVFLDKVYEEYSNLYKENAELVGKLKVCIGKIEEYREDEKFLKSAIVNAQKLNETAVQEMELRKKETEETARKQADEIIMQAKEKAQELLNESNDKIADFRERTTKEFAQQQQDNARIFESQMAEYEAQISAKKAEIAAISGELEEFRAKILSIFGAEIELINSLPKQETEIVQPETEPDDNFEDEVIVDVAEPEQQPIEEKIEQQADPDTVDAEEDVLEEIEVMEEEESVDEDQTEEPTVIEDEQINFDEVIAQTSPVEPAAPIFSMEDDEEEGASANDEFHLFGSNSPLVFPQDIGDESDDENDFTEQQEISTPRFKKKLKFGVDFDVKNDK